MNDLRDLAGGQGVLAYIGSDYVDGHTQKVVAIGLVGGDVSHLGVRKGSCRGCINDARLILAVNSYLRRMNNHFFESLPFSINFPHKGEAYTPMVCVMVASSFGDPEWLVGTVLVFRIAALCAALMAHEMVPHWQIEATYGI
ncbi:MAG TPA: hypothetical protein VK196_02370 [Magnetospirillum sp.]|nr:hypothetical protein [Magnetospirillum sp.]